ncbi:MAG TPA: hypothetical protein VHF86_07135, partial [Xanthomonadaceae bacterium]|nr:hypothetical protein [Xanthomonadaceae bacterium]
LEIGEAGHALVYTYDVQREETGIAALLKRLGEQGIEFKDLNTSESSLVFRSLNSMPCSPSRLSSAAMPVSSRCTS